MSKLRIDQLVSVFLLCLVFLTPVKSSALVAVPSPKVQLVEMAPLPILANSADSTAFIASLSARAVLVVDVPSAAQLLQKNSQTKLAPASTTKMMTALVARKIFALDHIIAIKKPPLNVGHTIGFAVGEKFLVRDVLKALLINSGNDAAEILAQNYSQGYEGFIELMNQTAAKLQLLNTAFVNPSGLDAAAHYSSAFDLSLIARELIKDDFLKSLVATKETQITDLSGEHTFSLYNTNLLLGRETGVVGIKTGTTDLAEEVLVTLVEKNNRQILIVILGSQDRYSDTVKIIQWIFSHYQWRNI